MKSCLLLLLPTALTSLLHSVAAQIPASYVPFGKSCGSGATPPRLSAPKLPAIGREFAVAVTNLRPNSFGFLMFGASNSRWNTFRLPLSLAPFGAAGCDLNVSLDQDVPLSTGSGTTHFRVRIPKTQSLAGVTFYNQFIVPDPGANNAGVSFSNGAKAIVGTCLCLQEEGLTESFSDEAMLDKQYSGGAWFGGQALPAQVGGTGRHGVFDYKLGKRTGSFYDWSTDNMTIPATHTETGRAEVITNGVFEFSSMLIPAGVKVRFVGSNPAHLKVRGVVSIDGKINCNGAPVEFFLAVPDPSQPPVAKGQAGGRPGPGGGRGGDGGDACPNTGPSPKYDGRAGADVRLKLGHAYAAMARGTGGKGSPHWPRSGRNSNYCALSGNFAGAIAAGGGGGGLVSKGRDGVATKNPCSQTGLSGTAPNSAGIEFDIGALVPRGGGSNRSLDHYAVGGAGGGGGGSHPLLARRTVPQWLAGSGGAGGGGILVLRVGRQLIMGDDAAILCRGGTGYVIDGWRQPGEGGDGLFNLPSPGGAGTGGTVLLQIAINTDLRGSIYCNGGTGGILDNTPSNVALLVSKAAGGDGGSGYIRLENPVLPTIGELGHTVPPATRSNVGKLVDYDVKVTTQTKFYNTGLGFSPHFLRYEIEAVVGGRKVVYSDDPNLRHPNFVGPATVGKPVQFRIQGVRVDQRTNGEQWRGDWRDNVRTGLRNSLGADDANGWRFQLTYDRTTARVVVVTRVTVYYQR